MKIKKTPTPRILLFDIETTPNLSYVWGRWEQNVIENVEDWSMLSFAYKWLGDKNVRAFSLPDFNTYRSLTGDSDVFLIKELWKLFDEADIIVAHNGSQFDIKKANARFLIHGLRPPSPYKVIDTKIVAKAAFRFDSNRLDELGRQLGVGQKSDAGGFETWKGCMNGDAVAWKRMVEYNKRDVALLEKVYIRLRPWIKSFPVTICSNGSCVHCGEDRLQKRGLGYTRISSYQRFQCNGCHAWSTGNRQKI